MSITLFIPVRKGSERVSNKNTKEFGRFEGGLLEYKLHQLTGLKEIYETVISSNDEKCLEIASSYADKIHNLKVIERPDELGSSSTKLLDLIRYAGDICEGKHVLWTHVTSPFFLAEDYREAIKQYKEIKSIGFDSLMTANEVQDYIINPVTGKLINNPTQEQWPRTQDLQKLFQINNAVFLAERNLYKEGKRTGENPFYMPVGKLASHDVDWEEDFKIAEAIYERIHK